MKEEVVKSKTDAEYLADRFISIIQPILDARNEGLIVSSRNAYVQEIKHQQITSIQSEPITGKCFRSQYLAEIKFTASEFRQILESSIDFSKLVKARVGFGLTCLISAVPDTDYVFTCATPGRETEYFLNLSSEDGPVLRIYGLPAIKVRK